jgi:hypothetical protein
MDRQRMALVGLGVGLLLVLLALRFSSLNASMLLGVDVIAALAYAIGAMVWSVRHSRAPGSSWPSKTAD